MELRRYIEIIRRRWWLVLAATVITSLLTVFFVIRQPWIYEASGTFVVRPRAVESEEVVRAFDTLNRGVEINATYAKIAESDLIEDLARQTLEGDFPSDLEVSADVVVGTNILEITVSGEDPEGVFALAQGVGSETVDYVSGLDDVFGLVPLDPAEQPRSPSAPNKPMTIALGTFLGLLLGIGLAVLGEYVGSPVRLTHQFDVFDSETGTHTETFFKYRFRQELSRSRRGSQTFSVGVLKVAERSAEKDGSVPKEDVLWKTARELENDLREEDILAYLGEGTYAVLLPDLPVEEAERLLVTWQDLIRSQGATNQISGDYRFEVSVGVCEYGSGASDLEWGEDDLAHVL